MSDSTISCQDTALLGSQPTPDTFPRPPVAGPELVPNGGLRTHVKAQLLSHQSNMAETRSLASATVRYLAVKHGYVEIELKDREAGYMLSFEHHNKKGCGGPGKEVSIVIIIIILFND